MKLGRESLSLVTLKEWLVLHVYSYGAEAFTASTILYLLRSLNQHLYLLPKFLPHQVK